MVIVDTSLIIDHLRQKTSETTYLMNLSAKQPPQKLAVSVISIQELYEGQSTKDEQKEQSLISILSILKILPYTFEIAKLAGEIARDLSNNIGLADAAIAATTIHYGYQLATLNNKDFAGIRGLELI